MSSYFFLESTRNVDNIKLINSLRDYSEKNSSNIYVLDRPLTDQKYNYTYDKGLIVLSPKSKVLIVNYGGSQRRFDEFVEDIIEDVGYISDKYNYKKILGRPRRWRESLIETYNYDSLSEDADKLLEQAKLVTPEDLKHVNLLISLFVGSINDVDRVKEEVPKTLLDKVKQKILLFDGNQTRFIYGGSGKKRTVIQGLSGTGKTELLLHKLKDLYILDSTSKIFFTCHNRILADNLKHRIPQFFNFMKVEQQIEWNRRLWCQHAWGSERYPDSGAYRYICAFYDIPFHRFSYSMSFSRATKLAYEKIVEDKKVEKIGHAFTYMFIDESQDFDENFFSLCEHVTEKGIYIAGDIFQNIFDENISSSIQPDYLLGKCYRTDPKTLMFAHGLGMGLFEKVKLRWLEEKEWKDCGYNYRKNGNTITLNREPLRRFEDLEDSFESIKVLRMEESYSFSVVAIIKEIFDENPTVIPDDIGIILLDGSRAIYELADTIQFKIQAELKLKVNKAYESKTKVKGAIMISNRNNVKGLEFPFVICVTMKLVNNITYRNSLYTMLTRSFIKSYLLISPRKDSGLTDSMFAGLNHIIKHDEMKIIEPSQEEKIQIQTRFKYELKKESYWDIMMRLFDDLDVKEKHKNNLLKAAVELEMTDSDEDQLREFIVTNIKLMNRQMKSIEIGIPRFESDNLFFALRNKLDYVYLLSNACRLLLIEKHLDWDNVDCVGKLRVVVDKMSRLFIFTNNKKISVHFPFTIEFDSSGIHIEKLYLKSGEEVDSLKLAAISAVVQSESFKLSPSVLNYYFMEKDIDEEGLTALEEVFLSESSYIRYDYDKENENGRIHPVNHIDINYSSNGTFKLGLYEILSDDEFLDLVNIRTECRHFEKKSNSSNATQRSVSLL